MPLESQLDQTVDQLAVTDPARLPQLRIHADRSKSGQRVDLVDDQSVRHAFEEEIDPRQARPVNRLEGANGESLDLGGHLSAKLGRYDQTRAVVVYVFRLVLVTLGGLRDDLSGQARYRLVVAKHADLDLTRVNALFHDDFPVVFPRRRNGLVQALRVDSF